MTKTNKPRKVAIYLRVSTHEQTTDNQRRELEAVAEAAGWQIAEIYEDAGISGAKGRDQRPAFDRLCRDASKRKFNLLAAWSVDRLGHSLKDLVGFLDDLHSQGIDLYLHRQSIDTTTPGGKAMFQMAGVFAEFERSMVQERVNSGLARAKASGKQLGRPKIDAKKEAAILADLAKGEKGIIKIAQAHGVGTGTVQRLKAQQQQAAEAA